MITVANISLRYGDKKLFEEVNLKFTPGNCYGVIGANGAGKSTFLKVLSGEVEANSGDVIIPKEQRMSVLQQDHYVFDDLTVMDTTIKGNEKLYNIMKEKEAIYSKEEMTDEDGMKASELEYEFAELDGWEAESDASYILQGLGITTDLHYKYMRELSGVEKVKVLLAQALFGKPGILILDEPTNHLDVAAINWLEEFIINFEGTVIVVSHDRHILNKICTHICDVDFGRIKLFAGNYDFWYESNQLLLRLMKEQNKKKEDRIKELQEFITRFSANASKSKQATSRKKSLDKISIDEMEPSNRRYPFINFKPDPEIGKDVIFVEGISKTIDGVKVLDDVTFIVGREDKIAFIGNDIAVTTLLKILASEMEPDSGSFRWGITATHSYFPKENNEFFENDLNLVDWLREYSSDKTDSYVRGFLGRMLFSGEEGLKKSNVLSGGEKVRCMFARMMLSNSNVLIFDQPTNHLDLESITALNKGLKDYPSVILMTSHDHELVQTVANRIIEIRDDGTIFDKQITYDDYLEYRLGLQQ